MKVLVPSPAAPPAIHNRMRKAVPRRKLPRGRIRVDKDVSVGSAMSSSGNFQKGDYGKDEKELREDDYGSGFIHLVEQDGTESGDGGQGVDGEDGSSCRHPQFR